MEERQKKHLEAVEQALLDVAGTLDWTRLRDKTGLSDKRAQEIVLVCASIDPK